MILKNAWNNTTPICAECQEEMKLEAASTKCFYKCPKCGKKFVINYFEKILDNIALLDEERQLSSELGSLVGEKFTIAKKVKCEIIEENDDMNKWKVSIKIIT